MAYSTAFLELSTHPASISTLYCPGVVFFQLSEYDFGTKFFPYTFSWLIT